MRKIRNTKAQISLELATAFFCMFLLLLASVKLCVWVVERMVVRQEDFDNSRVEAGTPGAGGFGEEVDESNATRYKDLHFFK